MKTRIRILTVLVATLALFLGTYTQPVLADAKPTDGAPIVLRGTIVTPDGVIKHGYILIENGRIMEVSDKEPDVVGAVELNTEGIIYPGLVDIHNHTPWNVIPRWDPPRLYSNRYQWRADPDYRQKVAIPFNNLINGNHFCDMNAYSEMRALVGGATSILATYPVPCIHGLVRNLDYNSSFYGTIELDREHIISAIEIPPASNPAARQYFVGLALYAIANPAYEALFLHLSEGVDAASLEEFTYIQSQGLLNPKGAIIHGIPLGPTQFQAMASSGTSLVWSPRSNVNLYGQTADINSALDAGVQIALAPDWAITGSSNMLDELHFADQWNQNHLNGRLTDEQLINMVTSIPAKIAGIDDEVGAIQPGLRADLLVVEGDHNDPYHALVSATAADVQLVIIDGVAVLGAPHYMLEFYSEEELETIEIDGTIKMIHMPVEGQTFADVVARLQTALAFQGISLALITDE